MVNFYSTYQCRIFSFSKRTKASSQSAIRGSFGDLRRDHPSCSLHLYPTNHLGASEDFPLLPPSSHRQPDSRLPSSIFQRLGFCLPLYIYILFKYPWRHSQNSRGHTQCQPTQVGQHIFCADYVSSPLARASSHFIEMATEVPDMQHLWPSYSISSRQKKEYHGNGAILENRIGKRLGLPEMLIDE